MNAQKPFGNETPQSTCCGGTGAENHVKYQEAAYFVSDSTLWVALYLPTTALWREKDVTLEQDCLWPAEESIIRIRGEAGFSMRLRVPYWATEGFEVKLNGKSLTARVAPSPSSYFEIPYRQWSAGDIVTVSMPFTKHIHFGPDKMDIAATGKNESQTPFNPQWVGAMMYGPLVMATPDVRSWFEADVNLSSDLREIRLLGPSAAGGTNGNLYAMSVGNNVFQPDYYQTGRSTHYLRLNVQTDGKKQTVKGKADCTALAEALQVARERKATQEAWQALAVKVPEYAPWASHGYARLLEQITAAETLVSRPLRSIKQSEVDATLSSLNMAINTMRPGNLAEPEDLSELLPLLTNAKNIPNKTRALSEAIQYADMVVQYVNDGSGTLDLIRKATQQLREALGHP